MDALVDLLPLVFIGLYYLLAARRRARIQKAERRRDEAPQEALVTSDGTASGTTPAEPTPFESFLEQLEVAMAEAGGVDAPERPDSEEEPRPASPVAEDPSARTPEFHAPAGSFDAPQPVDHEAHGFGDANPFSEERFERAPAFVAERPPADATYDPHGLRRPSVAPRRASRPATDWRRRLQDPQAARDAFLLQTIFGPRGGRHGDRSGR